MEKCKRSSLLWNNQHKVIRLTAASFFIIPSDSSANSIRYLYLSLSKLLLYAIYSSQDHVFH